MAFYTTVENVEAAIPRAINSVSNVNSSVIATHIQAADGIINGKLANLYAVPVSGSNLLDTIAVDIACYRLLRRQFTQERKNKSEWVNSYNDSMDMLKEIAKGKMTLTDSAGNIIAPRTNSGAWSNTESYIPTMNEDAFSEHFIDNNKLDAIEDDRESAG